MGIYTKLLNEDYSIQIIESFDNESMINSLESVVYNEYLINQSLLEVSFKDTKDKIGKAIEFLRQKIKELINIMKGFFKNKKLNKTLKDLEDAKKEINKLEKENNFLNSKIEDLEDENENLFAQGNRYKKRLIEIIKKGIEDPILYFDNNKYLDQDKANRLITDFRHDIAQINENIRSNKSISNKHNEDLNNLIGKYSNQYYKTAESNLYIFKGTYLIKHINNGGIEG